ncbi:hypothetical protein Tco_1093570, partial [Tanacetum coccineum]
KRQRDDNDLQDETQDQLKEEEVKPRRSKRARIEISFRLYFVSFMVENEPTSYRESFDMKDMGLADVIFGIKIIQTPNGLVLSQAHYVDKILNAHNAGDSGRGRTLIDTGTQSDLAYVVSMLSRLHYDRCHAIIKRYSDANWISNIKDSRWTSEYVFTLRGAAISWKSSKQTIIAKSIMESEFIMLD